MSQETQVVKAQMWEVLPSGGKGHEIEVQFNPETLKVTFANQVVQPSTNNASAQSNDRSAQFVGKGTTKLAAQLWFDVTSVLPTGKQGVSDVRQLTRGVTYFITPREDPVGSHKYKPPMVYFSWGSFQFEGIMESLEESLEYFSEAGKPLRASMSFSLTKQEVVLPPENTQRTLRPSPGARPLVQAPAGASLPDMATNAGQGANWQAIAQANNIENPRRLQPGQLIDLNLTTRR